MRQTLIIARDEGGGLATLITNLGLPLSGELVVGTPSRWRETGVVKE